MKLAFSMIAIRIMNNKIEILLQKRSNAGIEEWKDSWEFPQGSLRDECIIPLMNYKFNDETGMFLRKILISKDRWITPEELASNPTVMEPFIVVCERKYYVSHFIVVGEGCTIDTKHAYGHKWFALNDLESLLKKERICPLNQPAVQKIYEARADAKKCMEVLGDEV